MEAEANTGQQNIGIKTENGLVDRAIIGQKASSSAHSSIPCRPSSFSPGHYFDTSQNMQLDKEADNGSKTPPIPRYVPFSVARELLCSDKLAESAVNQDETADLDMDRARVPDSEGQKTTNGSLTVDQSSRCNKNILSGDQIVEDAECRFQIQRKRSINAFHILTTSLEFLQRNIQEVLGLAFPHTLSDYETGATPEVVKCKPKDNPVTKTFVSTGTDPIDFPDCNKEKDTTILTKRLEALEEKTKKRLQELEMKRKEMLNEIKKSQETLTKILGEIQIRMQNDDETNFQSKDANNALNEQQCSADEETLKKADVTVSTSNLNLQGTWEERGNENSEDENDYEAMISHRGLEIINSNGNGELGDLSSSENVTADQGTTSFEVTSHSSENDSIHHERDETRRVEGFVCKCGIKTKGRTALWNHIVRKNPPRFNCRECGMAFYFRADFNSHMMKQHDLIVDAKFNCYSCNEKFASRSDIVKHRGLCPRLSASKEKPHLKKSRLSNTSTSQ